jgi:hypothetical protein
VRADAAGGVDWRRSRGALSFAELATVGETLPELSAARGSVELDRGATRLVVEGGKVEDLDIQNARIEWPRRGAPRLQASLTGSLDSATLGAVLRPHGLGQLRGTVSLEADARGAEALHQPDLWRVTAQVRDARVSLGSEMPAIEALSGKIRYSGRQLRGLELAGRWLDGPVRIVSQRGGARAPLTFAGSGEADAAALLALVNGSGPMPQVTGELQWNGAAEFSAADGIWNISLTSTLVGLTSELPKPFAKARSRQVPVNASLSVAPEGLRMFEIEGGRGFAVRGDLQQGRWLARFEVQGISGELRRVTRGAGDLELQIESLEVGDAPGILSAAGHFLPQHERLAVSVNDLRAGPNGLGALNAAISRRESAIDFSLDSPAATLHRLTAHGECTAQTCRMEFTADTAHLAALLRSARLPPEWPVQSLHAMGSLHWPAVEGDLDIRALGGEFSFTAQGMGAEHQASARATLQDGDILLAEVQGTGPEPDQMFRGQGRIGLVARDYDLSVDYERIALASNAVPSSTRARLARAWNAVRGSAARQGWTEAPDTRRVQWHGSWEDAR